MTIEISDGKMLVALPEGVVGALLQIHDSLNADLVGYLHGLIADSENKSAASDCKYGTIPKSIQKPDKYLAKFLGELVSGSTLPEIFAQIVDLTAEVAPEALDKLAATSAKIRRFVARNPEAIHPGRRDLPVVLTSSGWWISRNIGQEDLKRALQALAQAAGLKFGEDITFSSNLG